MPNYNDGQLYCHQTTEFQSTKVDFVNVAANLFANDSAALLPLNLFFGSVFERDRRETRSFCMAKVLPALTNHKSGMVFVPSM